jgi:hypothetical protein
VKYVGSSRGSRVKGAVGTTDDVDVEVGTRVIGTGTEEEVDWNDELDSEVGSDELDALESNLDDEEYVSAAVLDVWAKVVVVDLVIAEEGTMVAVWVLLGCTSDNVMLDTCDEYDDEVGEGPLDVLEVWTEADNVRVLLEEDRWLETDEEIALIMLVDTRVVEESLAEDEELLMLVDDRSVDELRDELTPLQDPNALRHPLEQ